MSKQIWFVRLAVFGGRLTSPNLGRLCLTACYGGTNTLGLSKGNPTAGPSLLPTAYSRRIQWGCCSLEIPKNHHPGLNSQPLNPHHWGTGRGRSRVGAPTSNGKRHAAKHPPLSWEMKVHERFKATVSMTFSLCICSLGMVSFINLAWNGVPFRDTKPASSKLHWATF